MAFILGNHTIDEILEAVATDFDETYIEYTVDQLSNASIEITSDPREITDKKGNIVRRIFTSKNGTFNATNAFLHPAIMNAASGSNIEVASSTSTIEMPKIDIVAAGDSIDVTAAKEGSIKVVGIYGNGANTEKKAITAATGAADASFDPATGTGKYKLTTGADESVTLTTAAKPSGATGEYPVNYLVMYTRDVESGIKLTNTADKFPKAVRLTLFVSYVDPCSESLRPAYVVIPNFMPDPAMTLNLSSENQEVDFNGTLQVDYCSGSKILYYIYYPDEELVETGEGGDEGNS